MPNDVPDWTQVALMTENAIPGSPFTFARDGLFHNVNGVQLPLGCQWLVFGTALGGNLASILVTGTTTNIQYVSSSLVGIDFLNYVRVHPALDPVVNISMLISSGAGSTVVGVAFGFSPTVTDLDPATPSSVFLVTPNAANVAIDQGLDGGTNRVGMSLAGAKPGQVKVATPDWQAQAEASNPNPAASCSSGVSGILRAVVDKVTFSYSANAGRVIHGHVWDGASGGTRIGTVVLGSNGAAAGPTSVSATLYGLRSSTGNQLTFDYDFAPAAGELQAITASGAFQT